jgi:hypothetical protein
MFSDLLSRLAPPSADRRPRANRLRPAVEILEDRCTPAHIEAFPGGGVAATAKAGNVTDSHTLGLGDQDVSQDRLVDARAPEGSAEAIADVGYTNSPTGKDLGMDGYAFSLGNAPAASTEFGTSNFDSLDSLGNLMTFTIVADPGESNGQPIDVTLTGSAVSQTLEGTPGSGSYEIRYSNEQDGPFVQTLLSGDFSGGSSPSQTVTLHSAIGMTFSVGFKGNAAVGATTTDDSQVALTIDVQMTLGEPGPVPGAVPPSGASSGAAPGGTTGTTGSGSAGLAPPGHVSGGPKAHHGKPAAPGVGAAGQALLDAEQKLVEFGAIPGADATVNGQPNLDSNSWFFQRDNWVAHVNGANTPQALARLLRQLEANVNVNALQPSFAAKAHQFLRSLSRAKTAKEVSNLATELGNSVQVGF